MTGCCELCNRQAELTFHHLLPRTLHRNKWFKKRFSRDQMNGGINVCSQCHHAIHEFFDHKELGRSYNTKQALLASPEIKKYLQWASRQRVRHHRQPRASIE